MFDLKIGFKCNNNCIHCVVADKRPSGELGVMRTFAIIRSIPKEETEIQITGGEPTVYKHLPTILKACKERNLRVYLQTNATGFANKKFAEECAPYIYNAHVAIHSIDPEVHNRIVQDKTGTMWSKTMEGLKNLKDLGVCVTTQTVLSKYNIESVPDTFKAIQELYPGTHMSFTYPHLMGNAFKNREDICFRYSDYKYIIQEVLEKYRSVLFTESIPLCYLYPYVEEIECIEKDLINPYIERRGIDYADSFGEKNYQLLDLKGRAKIPTCGECIYNNKCVGVWKEYIQLYKNRIDLFPIRN